MERMTEEDVNNLKRGDTVYDIFNTPVKILNRHEYTIEMMRENQPGVYMYELPKNIIRDYTIHKREQSCIET